MQEHRAARCPLSLCAFVEVLLEMKQFFMEHGTWNMFKIVINNINIAILTATRKKINNNNTTQVITIGGGIGVLG